MNPEPETPMPLPKIPRARLWGALLIPARATLAGSLIVGWLRESDDYGLTFLWVPFQAFFAIFGGALYFNRTIGIRYQGRSKLLLGFYYIVGQIVTCLALWLGSCSLLMR